MLNKITKVSEISVQDVAEYIRVDSPDNNEIETYLNVAKNFIENYTGIPKNSTDTEAETLDSYQDFIIVVLILCQDMYDNRSLYVDKNELNKVVKTILDMHTRNNL